MNCRSREFLSFNSSRKSKVRNETDFPGALVEYLTGRQIPFSNRDNIRQKLIKTLVEEKGYGKGELSLDREIRFEFEGQQVCSLVDISIALEDKTLMVFKCAPGSVVSRERQIIATARLLESYIIPCAVVTNGIDIEMLDAFSEKVIGEGVGSIPTRLELYEISKNLLLKPVNSRKLQFEKNILYTYDAISCTLYCKSDSQSE
jgi:hypothetical protein